MTTEAFEKISAGLREVVRSQRLIAAILDITDPPFEMTRQEAIEVLSKLDVPIP